MNKVSDKIQQFLAQFNVDKEIQPLIEQSVLGILYVDLYERIIKQLPDSEKVQARSYLLAQTPEIDGDTHVKIKAFVQKHLTEELVSEYLENNLDKVLSMIAESVLKNGKMV